MSNALRNIVLDLLRSLPSPSSPLFSADESATTLMMTNNFSPSQLSVLRRALAQLQQTHNISNELSQEWDALVALNSTVPTVIANSDVRAFPRLSLRASSVTLVEAEGINIVFSQTFSFSFTTFNSSHCCTRKIQKARWWPPLTLAAHSRISFGSPLLPETCRRFPKHLDHRSQSLIPPRGCSFLPSDPITKGLQPMMRCAPTN